MKKPVSISLALVAMALSVGLVAAVAAPLLNRAAPASADSSSTSVIPKVTDGSAASIASGKNLDGTWSVQQGSTAGYQVTEGRDGAVLTGSTDDVDGTLTVRGRNLVAAEVTVDLSTITCGNAAADRYLRRTALQTDRYPTAEITLDEPIDVALGSVAGQIQTITGTGSLTLHGVTRPVSLTLQASFGADGATVTGTIPIDFTEYGVTGPDFGFAVADTSATVGFALEAAKQ
ncbi:YceI family protein [Subtercola sp. YIM 133946]|uniref:YceI family protein n=1 Tax=Subtercola sp. YIM 133946 TaxID=3118909 RepID=UPI002F942831